MVKTAALALRIDPKLKTQLETEAEREGRSLASYVERILETYHDLLRASKENASSSKDARPPRWKLLDPRPHNFRKSGARVSLQIAEGMPLALLSADHAAELGKQLTECAKLAPKMPLEG